MIFHMRVNEKTDRNILDWLSDQSDKTAAVKAALRIVIAGGLEDTSSIETADQVADLAAIRAVVETALEQHLSRLSLASGLDDAALDDDPELMAKLDAMF